MQIANVGDREPQEASKLEEIRRTAVHRLQEIEPLIEEAERLRDVLSVIEQHQFDAVGSQPSNGNGHRNPSRAPKGANKRIILELIAQRPGITVAEIAQMTNVKRTVVASTVSRLKRHGELEAHEHGMRVAGH